MEISLSKLTFCWNLQEKAEQKKDNTPMIPHIHLAPPQDIYDKELKPEFRKFESTTLHGPNSNKYWDVELLYPVSPSKN